MSVRPLWPDELVELAYLLAGRGARAGRPKTTHLRRAVSSAYYALFHELCLHATDALLVGAGPPDVRYSEAARWFERADVRNVALAVLSTGGRDVRAVAAAFDVVDTDLVRVAEGFVTLQDERMRADYDHTYDASRPATLQLTDQARDAIVRLRRLSQNQDASYILFIKLMVGATRIAKRR